MPRVSWRIIMKKEALALLLVGGFTVAQMAIAVGNDSTLSKRGAAEDGPSANVLGDVHLPPVPHMESIPWLTYRSSGQNLKVDTLLGRDVDTLELNLWQPETSAAQPSPSARKTESQLWTK